MINFSNNYLLKLSCLFVIVTKIGLILSLWFGLGWFVLAFLGRRVLFLTPELYIPFIWKVFGAKIAEVEKLRYAKNNVHWTGRALPFIYLVIIFVVFYKYNIPLLEIGK